jgi:prephenate dehydrogenase (NADP+)
MKLAIIGFGTMGQYCAQELASRSETVYLRTTKPEQDVERILNHVRNYKMMPDDESAVHDADIVLFCLPTELIYEKMLHILPYCKKGAIISGQTSRKSPEAQAFDDYSRRSPTSGLEMVTIHTMCDPKRSDPRKEILGIIRHRSTDETYQRAFDFYSGMSEHVEEFESVDEHDSMTANTQIDTSRILLSIASAFAKVGCFPWVNETYGSAFDIMKFSLAMRAANQDSHVYRGIQFGSEYGKDIVVHSSRVENELFSMVVGNQQERYRSRVLAAKRKIFGTGSLYPILADDVMRQFGSIDVTNPNSDFSIVFYVVALAEKNKNPFDYLKATTPNHTALLCLADRLFTSEEGLERAIAAPFNNPRLRSDDLGFHNEINGWSDALLFDNIAAYNSRHAAMRSRLNETLLRQQVETSRRVIAVCRENMNQALRSKKRPIIF